MTSLGVSGIAPPSATGQIWPRSGTRVGLLDEELNNEFREWFSAVANRFEGDPRMPLLSDAVGAMSFSLFSSISTEFPGRGLNVNSGDMTFA